MIDFGFRRTGVDRRGIAVKIGISAVGSYGGNRDRVLQRHILNTHVWVNPHAVVDRHRLAHRQTGDRRCGQRVISQQRNPFFAGSRGQARAMPRDQRQVLGMGIHKGQILQILAGVVGDLDAINYRSARQDFVRKSLLGNYQLIVLLTLSGRELEVERQHDTFAGDCGIENILRILRVELIIDIPRELNRSLVFSSCLNRIAITGGMCKGRPLSFFIAIDNNPLHRVGITLLLEDRGDNDLVIILAARLLDVPALELVTFLGWIVGMILGNLIFGQFPSVRSHLVGVLGIIGILPSHLVSLHPLCNVGRIAVHGLRNRGPPAVEPVAGTSGGADVGGSGIAVQQLLTRAQLRVHLVREYVHVLHTIGVGHGPVLGGVIHIVAVPVCDPLGSVDSVRSHLPGNLGVPTIEHIASLGRIGNSRGVSILSQASVLQLLSGGRSAIQIVGNGIGDGGIALSLNLANVGAFKRPLGAVPDKFDAKAIRHLIMRAGNIFLSIKLINELLFGGIYLDLPLAIRILGRGADAGNVLRRDAVVLRGKGVLTVLVGACHLDGVLAIKNLLSLILGGCSGRCFLVLLPRCPIGDILCNCFRNSRCPALEGVALAGGSTNKLGSLVTGLQALIALVGEDSRTLHAVSVGDGVGFVLSNRNLQSNCCCVHRGSCEVNTQHRIGLIVLISIHAPLVDDSVRAGLFTLYVESNCSGSATGGRPIGLASKRGDRNITVII